MKRLLLLTLICLQLFACNSSVVEDAVDIVDGVPEKTIDTDILGANAFANDGRFGSPASQYREVKSTLGINFIRFLVRWDDNIQPSKASPLNFSFADTLVASLPAGMDAMIVLTGTPSWMRQPANWDGGNPRTTFVNEFLAPVVARYAGAARIIGFQVWNEPNQVNTDNSVMGFTDQPALYVEMLRASSRVIRRDAPAKLVITAATTAINQNYPDSLNYNRGMRDAGAQTLADIWAIHYYGRQYENVVRPGGVADFARGVALPIWITETGEQGVNKQLKYARQTWPYLTERIPSIERIYLYQFTEATPSTTTYGLRNPSKDAPVSDLYLHLAERAR